MGPEQPECPEMMPMARFLLFSGHTYYPNGGWEDLRAVCATVEEAHALIAACPESGITWYQIVDLRTRTIVEQAEVRNHGRHEQRERR